MISNVLQRETQDSSGIGGWTSMQGTYLGSHLSPSYGSTSSGSTGLPDILTVAHLHTVLRLSRSKSSGPMKRPEGPKQPWSTPIVGFTKSSDVVTLKLFEISHVMQLPQIK